jgi:hypothetical protein
MQGILSRMWSSNHDFFSKKIQDRFLSRNSPEAFMQAKPAGPPVATKHNHPQDKPVVFSHEAQPSTGQACGI